MSEREEFLNEKLSTIKILIKEYNSNSSVYEKLILKKTINKTKASGNEGLSVDIGLADFRGIACLIL